MVEAKKMEDGGLEVVYVDPVFDGPGHAHLLAPAPRRAGGPASSRAPGASPRGMPLPPPPAGALGFAVGYLG